MNSLTIILILLAIIAILGGVIYVLIKNIKSKKKKEIQNLNSRLESAKINIEQLSKYIDEVLKIKSDEKSISQKIKEAESDEEVYNIIADIVGANNNRMQNNKS